MEAKHHTVGANFTYQFADPSADASDFFDEVVGHLHALDTDDVFVSVDYKAKAFYLSLLVTSKPHEKVEQVIAQGMGTMRTAFQACGASTPDWPEPDKAIVSVDVASVNATLNEEAPTTRSLAAV